MTAAKSHEPDKFELDFCQKASIKVDTSAMALRLRDYYARKALCEICIEIGRQCPFNYDPIACIYDAKPIC